MWNLTYDTDELIYKTEADSQIEDRRGCQGRVGEGWTGGLGLAGETITYRMDKWQGPTVQHREVYSISLDKPYWKRIF